MHANQHQHVPSPLTSEEVLDKVQQLFTRLQLLCEGGTSRHSAAYTALEREIRFWAERFRRLETSAVAPAGQPPTNLHQQRLPKHPAGDDAVTRSAPWRRTSHA
jgi:hypothetical protein